MCGDVYTRVGIQPTGYTICNALKCSHISVDRLLPTCGYTLWAPDAAEGVLKN